MQTGTSGRGRIGDGKTSNTKQHFPDATLTPLSSGRPQPLLTTSQVARWLEISARTVTYWAASGVIPAVKMGRHWRFQEGVLQKWIESRQRRP
jgi:excisionase family DNA binding protein